MKIHVWLGSGSSSAIEAYVSESRRRDGGPLSGFARDWFGGWYDHDWIGIHVHPRPVKVATLLTHVSAEEDVPTIVPLAANHGFERANAVVIWCDQPDASFRKPRRCQEGVAFRDSPLVYIGSVDGADLKAAEVVVEYMLWVGTLSAAQFEHYTKEPECRFGVDLVGAPWRDGNSVSNARFVVWRSARAIPADSLLLGAPHNGRLFDIDIDAILPELRLRIDQSGARKANTAIAIRRNLMIDLEFCLPRNATAGRTMGEHSMVCLGPFTA